MKFNQQKAWLIDLDIQIGKIFEQNQPQTFEDLWDRLPTEYKDNSIKWYVRERFNDVKGLPNEEDIYGISKKDY